MTRPRWLSQTTVDLDTSEVLDQTHGNAEGQGHLALQSGDLAASQGEEPELAPRCFPAGRNVMGPTANSRRESWDSWRGLLLLHPS